MEVLCNGRVCGHEHCELVVVVVVSGSVGGRLGGRRMGGPQKTCDKQKSIMKTIQRT